MSDPNDKTASILLKRQGNASEITSGENPDQNLLPDVEVHMNGKITRFPDAKTASAGN